MYSWTTAQHTHEGFPLFLRRPTNVDTPANRRVFSVLAVITHEFRMRFPDGRPDLAYNDSLADFDHAIVTAFDSSENGVPVLVETFGGKRHYYFYVSPQADVSAAVSRIEEAFPDEPISQETKPDADWSFLDRYAKEYFPMPSPSAVEQNRKSPLHLLFLPLTFVSIGVFCYLFVRVVCAVAAVAQPGLGSFASHSETAKTWIVIPLLFASFPISFVFTNVVIWIIPPARRFFNREAAGRTGSDFVSANHSLLKLAAYLVPLLFGIALAVAIFDR